MLKKRSGLLIPSVFFLSLSGLEQAHALFGIGEESGPSTAEVGVIVEQTREIKDEVKELSENYVISNVKKYNDMIAAITHDVNGKTWIFWQRDEAEKFQIILDGIQEITDFYSEITTEKRKAEVRNEMIEHIADIKKYAIGIDVQIEQDRNAKQILEKELKSLESASAVADPQYLETRKRSLLKRIEFADQRLTMLKQFKENYARIEPTLQNTLQRIDAFMLVVEESAKVYKDAYRTLKLSRDINAAYEQLEDFQKLDPLSNSLVKSWDELETLVKTLTEQVAHFKGE